ncbi:hypothetical protein AKO1_015742 [Acrasis kona]|uniref:Uncharacterized protein n=1 Tax=Acrasis kona TaxID=1008807 RepID=A0AAW2ZIF9_9EUKA
MSGMPLTAVVMPTIVPSIVECNSEVEKKPDKARHVHKKKREQGCCFCQLVMNPKSDDPDEHYVASNIEQVANVATHLIATVVAVAALWYSIVTECDDTLEIVAACVFGLGLTICFGVSTMYHLSSLLFNHWTPLLLSLDLSGIFLLISAAYTPWMIITLSETIEGNIICFVIWALGIFGIVKTFGKFLPSITAINIYMAMSFMSVFALNPLSRVMEMQCVYIIVMGIAFVGIGFIFFTQDGRVPFAHAIFHTFVAVGMLGHYYAVHNYILSIKRG